MSDFNTSAAPTSETRGLAPQYLGRHHWPHPLYPGVHAGWRIQAGVFCHQCGSQFPAPRVEWLDRNR